MLEELKQYAKAESERSHAFRKFKPFKLGSEWKAQYQGTATPDCIRNTIKEIRENVPLPPLRVNSTVDALAVCRAIKDYSPTLWEKLIVYSLAPRSYWGSVMKEFADCGSLSPLVLIAYREQVPFSAWDCKENFDTRVAMYLCLGTFLGNLMYARPTEPYTLDKETLLENMPDLKFNFAKSKFMGDTSDREAAYDGSKVNFQTLKPMVYMQAQTWICHPSIRVPEAMILDIYDWDLVPEPLEPLEVEPVFSVEYVEDDL